jgi:hypothetical protein
MSGRGLHDDLAVSWLKIRNDTPFGGSERNRLLTTTIFADRLEVIAFA